MSNRRKLKKDQSVIRCKTCGAKSFSIKRYDIVDMYVCNYCGRHMRVVRDNV